MTFIYEPPEDETVDGQYRLEGTNIAIQDASGYLGYCVTSYQYDGDRLVSARHHRTFKSLAAAQRYALKLQETIR
jgi:hypothetical protein